MDFVHRLNLKNAKFRKGILIKSSGIAAPNVVDTLVDRIVWNKAEPFGTETNSVYRRCQEAGNTSYF